MENPKPKLINSLITAGLILIPVMLFVLVLTSLKPNVNRGFFEDSGGFFVNYIFALVFFLIVLITNRPFFRFRQIDKRLIVISLILFSISSFTLNNSLVIFAGFTLWVKLYLTLFYSAFLGTIYIEKIPKLLRCLVFLFLGAGIVITTYFAVYLAPFYHVSIIGLIFFGLTIHLLVPLLVTVSVIIVYIKTKKSKTEKTLFYSGLILPILVTIVFLFQWGSFKNEIHKSTSSIITRPDNTLPEWVLLCQDMPTDKFSQKIIKGNLVYETFKDMWRGWGNTQFDEIKRHDPLVNIGIAILGDINLDRDTRVKILKSQFNARHLAQRKLWSGRNLGTIEVLNNIKVFPDYRIAYSEKIITVKNFSQWEGNQQEAAFTFYLPEGSVATSLSLWINGKEEKSRLTTKSKADSAYVSIVGVERRDPALLHWQEGNTLTVTVFPCTPKENRRFKIGITTPLKKINDILKLQNVYFDGPVSHDILETSQITFESEDDIKNISVPNGFKKGLENNFTYNGKFRPYWEVSCKATRLSQNEFFFNQHSYSISELDKQSYNFNPDIIYLDLNKSWTEKEFDEIFTLFSKKQIYIHYDKLIKVNEDNKSEVFEILSKKNFSLFPFNEIANWGNSLVISKSAELSPNLSDLGDSQFLEELIQKIKSFDGKVNLYQIGEVTSPFLKSLKEFQIINFHSGSLSELSDIVAKGYFYQYNSDTSKINLDIAGICIQKDTKQVQSKAPDHLLRLFAYNALMKQMGRNYFNKNQDYINGLVEIANEAYIVSPVSSLIVLETIKDYERFDIPENENSLKNASVKSSGAVPEPEEWILICLFVGMLISLFLFKKKLYRVKWK
jgi:XrtN system VIT domain protein